MEECATVTELDSIQITGGGNDETTTKTESLSPLSSSSSSTTTTTNDAIVIRTFVLHLRNTKVHLCSWGASILHFFVAEKKDDTNNNTADDNDYDDTDQYTDIVCGYKTAKDMYQSQNPYYFQATVGRVANRIANGGTFTLDGKRYQIPINNPPYCALHGGTVGWSHQNWDARIVHHSDDDDNANAVQFILQSKDGDQGFPGTVQTTLTYRLRPSLSSTGVVLQLHMEAILLDTHASTPINLTQHSYFNLMGSSHHHGNGEGILDHTLELEADAYTLVDQNGIPTQQVQLLDHDVVMDFRQPKVLRDALHDYGIQKMGLPPKQAQINIKERHLKLSCAPYGLDHNYIVRKQSGISLPQVALLSCQSKTLTIYSDAPGVQCYTANYLGMNSNNDDDDYNVKATRNLKAPYRRWDAICLETQHFPNSIYDDNDDNDDDDDNACNDCPSLFGNGKCPILTTTNSTYRHTVVYQLETVRGWQQSYQGSNTNGKDYPSINAMWEDEDLSTWYTRAKRWYEDNCDTTIDGVLGGIGHISDLDLNGSMEFLKRLDIPSSSNDSICWACDVGAGIGRVTKGLLLEVADRLDLIESSSRLLMAAPDYIGSRSSHCRFFCQDLQDWQPPVNKYSLIWIQWVLCYLTDKDVVTFLQRCSDSLIKGGWIVLKENTCDDQAFVVDTEDASITRSLPYWLDLIAKSGLHVRHLQWQDNFPKDIFPVPMLALHCVDDR
jgi:protein N-terminal methyltransferase